MIGSSGRAGRLQPLQLSGAKRTSPAAPVGRRPTWPHMAAGAFCGLALAWRPSGEDPMPLRFAFLACLLTLSSNAFAQDIVTDCDKYAASDTDPSAKAPGVPFEKVNPALAVRACKAAVKQFSNNARLLFQLGRAYQATGEQFNPALEYYRKAAEQSYGAAQESLGDMYTTGIVFTGQGVPPDDQQAAAWYRKAAEQGLPSAQNKLGKMYWDGHGVPQDTQQAIVWFRKAADQGFEPAQINLAAVAQNPAPPPPLDMKTSAYGARVVEEFAKWYLTAPMGCESVVRTTTWTSSYIENFCRCVVVELTKRYTLTEMSQEEVGISNEGLRSTNTVSQWACFLKLKGTPGGPKFEGLN
jgi:Sel1 repeat